MYDAQILADSVPEGEGRTSPNRLITIQATFPRFILAEVNTHRALSRNSASSRAMPPEKVIERVKQEPFVPETFNKRVKGMGVGEEMNTSEASRCRARWLEARDDAVRAAEWFVASEMDKSRVNRILEPFMWHTAIITGTDWDNFFALRAPQGDQPDRDFPAQLEFQKIALMMREAMRASAQQALKAGEWHLPMVTTDDEEDLDLPMLSAGRCARVSYETHESKETKQRSIERAGALRDAGHMSPFEHQARVAGPGDSLELRSSNLSHAWVQMRKLIPNEDNLIGHQEGRPRWSVI